MKGYNIGFNGEKLSKSIFKYSSDLASGVLFNSHSKYLRDENS